MKHLLNLNNYKIKLNLKKLHGHYFIGLNQVSHNCLLKTSPITSWTQVKAQILTKKPNLNSHVYKSYTINMIHTIHIYVSSDS